LPKAWRFLLFVRKRRSHPVYPVDPVRNGFGQDSQDLGVFFCLSSFPEERMKTNPPEGGKFQGLDSFALILAVDLSHHQ
jgi:hypothetical protein